MAAGVVGDAMRVVGADILRPRRRVRNSENSKTLGSRLATASASDGIVEHPLGHKGVVVAHHGDATGGRDDNGFGSLN